MLLQNFYSNEEAGNGVENVGESSSKLLQNIYITQYVASKNIEVHQTSRMKAKKSDKYFSKSTRL